MSPETWVLFVPAAFALNMYPGPNNVLAMTNGARYGFGTALLASTGRFPPFAGFVLGAAVGLGAALAASAEFFTAIKIAGAIYLVWLGLKMVLGGASDLAEADGSSRLVALARREFLTAITNPKAMLVFTAFFAPFVDPTQPAFGQILQLGAAALALEAVAVALYAFAGSRLERFVRDARRLALVNRISGTALIVAGALLLFARRPAQA
jgi:threonine/homoserine/homoserine lactone efflux protein